ncbi:MAG: FtsX-like permease family protein [Balneolaceae bacterium]
MKLLNEFFSPFNWKLAFRDARPQWKSLLLYTSAVIAGVAALVAILSFRSDVLLTIDEQSKELLGADLEFRSSQPFNDTVEAFIDSIGGSTAEAVEFNSMVLFKTTGQTRLSQIRAIEGPFPMYGTLETYPAEAAHSYKENVSALVEQSTMQQFGVQPGDSIQVGNVDLPISGELISVPGEAAAFSLIGPRVYIPKSVLEDSGLLERGSRVTYKRYFEIEPVEKVSEITEAFRPISRENSVRYETVESEKEDFDEVVENLSKFLGLIAFIALLLGGLGVASAVYVYIKRKTATVATLRCLGMPAEKILVSFAIQIAAIGFLGAAAGTLIGIFIQSYLPMLFTDFLPFEIVQAISVPAVLLGLFTGVLISVSFSLLPLAGISRISPMLTLRDSEFSAIRSLPNLVKILSAGFTLLVLILIVGFLTESIMVSLMFTLCVAFFVLLLWFLGNFLMAALKGLRLKSFTYVWRQGTANLFRPNNQTAMLMTTLGMGMMLIGTLYLSQDILLQRIDLQSNEEAPDLVFYDIQTDQNEGTTRIIEDLGANIIQNVPIVSMRLESWKERPVAEVREDTTVSVRGWALRREYRVTYRDHINDSETITEGEWIGEGDGIQSVVPISIADQIAYDLEIEVGDSLGFNVQGVPVKTVVASIREVNFQRPEPNFFILFPVGVLEPAPQFFATMIRTENVAQTEAIQQAVVSEFPNISAIDVSLALKSVQEFLEKISMAIQFMALFSILTGFIVLASSIAISRKQRTREAVLLRTLGAEKSQISTIQTIEYALLGFLASLTGFILAIAASWGLARYYFELSFVPDMWTLAAISLLITVAAILIGWTGSRHIFKHSPLEILRLETT